MPLPMKSPPLIEHDAIFLDGTQDQGPTIINVPEITKGVSEPTTAEEGNIWWQTYQLVQHVFFDGVWQLTGASYDTQTRRYVPVSIGDGLTYSADGVMAAVAAGGGTGFAAGDIVISLDDPLPSTLLELNGVIYVNGTTQYPGICARYPWMVIGSSLHLPNFRGAVPRHLDPTSLYDPDTNSRLARVIGALVRWSVAINRIVLDNTTTRLCRTILYLPPWETHQTLCLSLSMTSLVFPSCGIQREP